VGRDSTITERIKLLHGTKEQKMRLLYRIASGSFLLQHAFQLTGLSELVKSEVVYAERCTFYVNKIIDGLNVRVLRLNEMSMAMCN